MGVWDESHDAHHQVEHEGKLSHELLAGAASFGAMKLFEDHQRKEGKAVSHSFAKEAIAGLVGSQVDRLIETKGMDEVDKLKAKHAAKERAEAMYSEHYEQNLGANEYDPNKYQSHHSLHHH